MTCPSLPLGVHHLLQLEHPSSEFLGSTEPLSQPPNGSLPWEGSKTTACKGKGHKTHGDSPLSPWEIDDGAGFEL